MANKKHLSKVLSVLLSLAMLTSTASAAGIGVATHMGQDNGRPIAETISAAKQVKATWIRDEIKWNQVETSVGSLAIPAKADWLTEAKKEGFNTLVILGYGNPERYSVAATGTNSDTQGWWDSGIPKASDTSDEGAAYYNAYLNYVRFVSTNLGDKIDAYEVWNEPDHKPFNGNAVSGADYAKLLKDVYKIIKGDGTTAGTDPTATVLGGSFAHTSSCTYEEGTAIENFMADMVSEINANGGASAYMDAVSFHSYEGTKEPEGVLEARMNSLKSSFPNMDLWLTETGWTSGWSGIDQKDKAKYTIRNAVMYDEYLRENDMNGVYIDYELHSTTGSTEGENNFGSYNNDWTPLEKAKSINIFNKVTADKTLQSLEKNSDSYYKATYTNTDGDTAYVLWAKDDATASPSVTASEGAVKYDYLGVPSTFTSGNTVTLTEGKPVIIDCNPKAAGSSVKLIAEKSEYKAGTTEITIAFSEEIVSTDGTTESDAAFANEVFVVADTNGKTTDVSNVVYNADKTVTLTLAKALTRGSYTVSISDEWKPYYVGDASGDTIGGNATFNVKKIVDKLVYENDFENFVAVSDGNRGVASNGYADIPTNGYEGKAFAVGGYQATTRTQSHTYLTMGNTPLTEGVYRFETKFLPAPADKVYNLLYVGNVLKDGGSNRAGINLDTVNGEVIQLDRTWHDLEVLIDAGARTVTATLTDPDGVVKVSNTGSWASGALKYIQIFQWSRSGKLPADVIWLDNLSLTEEIEVGAPTVTIKNSTGNVEANWSTVATRVKSIDIDFGVDMLESTVNENNITLKAGNAAVESDYSYANGVFTIAPKAELEVGTEYTISVSENVKYIDNTSVETAQFKFTTEKIDIYEEDFEAGFAGVPAGTSKMGIHTYYKSSLPTGYNGTVSLQLPTDANDTSVYFTAGPSPFTSGIYKFAMKYLPSATNGASHLLYIGSTLNSGSDRAGFNIDQQDGKNVTLTREWHTVEATIDTDNGMVNVKLIAPDGTVLTDNTGNWSGELQYIQIRQNNAGNSMIQVDNIKIRKLISIKSSDITIKNASGETEADWNDVDRNLSSIEINFGREMSGSTLNASTVTLKAGDIAVNCDYSYADGILKIAPKMRLTADTEYVIGITGNAYYADNTSVEAVDFRFKTEKTLIYEENFNGEFAGVSADNSKMGIRTYGNAGTPVGYNGTISLELPSNSNDTNIYLTMGPNPLTSGVYKFTAKYLPTTTGGNLMYIGATTYSAPGDAAGFNTDYNNGAKVTLTREWHTLEAVIDVDAKTATVKLIKPDGTVVTENTGSWNSNKLQYIQIRQNKAGSGDQIQLDDIVLRKIDIMSQSDVTITCKSGAVEDDWTAVNRYVAGIAVDFGTEMKEDTLTASNITLKTGDTAVDCDYSYANGILTVSPKSRLAEDTTYKIAISSNVLYADEIPVEAVEFTFKTEKVLIYEENFDGNFAGVSADNSKMGIRTYGNAGTPVGYNGTTSLELPNDTDNDSNIYLTMGPNPLTSGVYKFTAKYLPTTTGDNLMYIGATTHASPEDVAGFNTDYNNGAKVTLTREWHTLEAVIDVDAKTATVKLIKPDGTVVTENTGSWGSNKLQYIEIRQNKATAVDQVQIDNIELRKVVYEEAEFAITEFNWDMNEKTVMKAYAKGTNPEGKTIQLYMAEYDGNGRMLDVTVEETSATEIDFSVSRPITSNTVKVFLWEKDTIEPLKPAL